MNTDYMYRGYTKPVQRDWPMDPQVLLNIIVRHLVMHNEARDVVSLDVSLSAWHTLIRLAYDLGFSDSDIDHELAAVLT